MNFNSPRQQARQETISVMSFCKDGISYPNAKLQETTIRDSTKPEREIGRNIRWTGQEIHPPQARCERIRQQTLS